MTMDSDAASQIRQLLQGASTLSVSSHVRTEELGRQLDFSACESAFEDFKRMGLELSNTEWSRLPQGSQDTASQILWDIRDAMRDIRRFSAVQGPERRNELEEAYRQKLDAFKEIALTYGGYLLWEGSGGEERILPALQEAEQRLQSIKRGEEEIEKTKAEVGSVLETVRDAAAEAGVSQEAATFESAAARYSGRARWWLAGSIVGIAGTIGTAFGLVLLWQVTGQVSDAEVLQIVLAKAAALAVLSYATINAVRLYRSNAHLAAVNRHREDALRTFRTFVEGTDSDEVKDKVLLAAAHAAFGQTATGLIGDKAESGNSFEVLDGIAGGLIRRQ